MQKAFVRVFINSCSLHIPFVSEWTSKGGESKASCCTGKTWGWAKEGKCFNLKHGKGKLETWDQKFKFEV